MSYLPPSDPQASTPPTPGATPSAPGSRFRAQRSLSRGSSSHWSVADTPQHHNYGTSYFPSGSGRAASPTPRRVRPPPPARSVSAPAHRRGPGRSTSVAKSARGEGPTVHVEDDEDDDDDEDEEANAGSLGRRHASRDTGRDNAEEDEEEEDEDHEEEPVTLKDRQSLINVEHPFGLPMWKPALYKKSRSVTRYADQALHSVPSAQAQRHLLPGNIAWTLIFGWWLAAACVLVSAILFFIPRGGKRYARLLYGLGWYLVWPFGKFVEGDLPNASSVAPEDEERPQTGSDDDVTPGASGSHEHLDANTTSRVASSKNSTITPRNALQHSHSVSWVPPVIDGEETALLPEGRNGILIAPIKSYGATSPSTSYSSEDVQKANTSGEWLGKLCFWLAFTCLVAPLMLIVCLICWGLVITIPMAKLNWALLKHMFSRPDTIRFCAAPPDIVVADPPAEPTPTQDGTGAQEPPAPRSYSVKPTILSAGQVAPSGSPTATVLLCTYRAVGFQYYKYTVGGVNILFVNLIPVVFCVIIDGMVILRIVEKREQAGEHVPAVLAFLASRALIFVLSLLSVIPLSYFIGMAVASISAQSSIGMGAVINATFGSIIEIILYCIALNEGKGRLVEGSIIGSLLAGVLLMPGMSMCSGAVRKKEMKFNAKSAGVTSTMLIMAIIGTLTPTLFYQTYGNFQMVCEGCPEHFPEVGPSDRRWECQHCYYRHTDPTSDPFYQETVKSLMYFCAAVLVLSYLIGLWFSLRTHATQIWQNPNKLLHALDIPVPNRLSLYHRPAPPGSGGQRLRRKPSNITNASSVAPSRSDTPTPRQQEPLRDPLMPEDGLSGSLISQVGPPSPTVGRRVSYAPGPAGQLPVPVVPVQVVPFTPLLESVDHAIKDTGLQSSQFPTNMTPDEFTRAVAVATVSALRHQQAHAHPGVRLRASGMPLVGEAEEAAGGHGGHDAPSWSRTVSASVLLGCTFLYAIIAEILVKVVDVVLEGSGIDEKFLGITLFALVPNTTEFMNAMAFALNGNIALSMEIGSAYALQVCLLQIPAMVAFSAFTDPENMGTMRDTFTLIFPRWDVIVIILSVFLMTYTYIEAKSNYHRGSILVLSYLVLVAGFFYAPHRPSDQEDELLATTNVITSSSVVDSVRFFLSSLLTL